MMKQDDWSWSRLINKLFLKRSLNWLTSEAGKIKMMKLYWTFTLR